VKIKSINIKKDFPELILLDINMPRVDGFEFLTEYEKEFADCSHSVIVMLITSIKIQSTKKNQRIIISKLL